MHDLVVLNLANISLRHTHCIAVSYPLFQTLPPLHSAVHPCPQSRTERLTDNPYSSVDPAPPADEPSGLSVSELRAALLDGKLPLFERYRAMFSLRNRGDAESVTALADGEWTVTGCWPMVSGGCRVAGRW